MREDLVVLALPRGGVPVGYEVARGFGVPLDVLVVRKLGAPGNLEFGVGAIAEGGVRVLDGQVIAAVGISEEEVSQIEKKERKELRRRVRLYRGKPLQNLSKKIVILVDDGLATGVTARAAIVAVRKLHPKKIIFASPVCPRNAAEHLRTLVDEVVCLVTPEGFSSVGDWYQDFSQVSDSEVVSFLKRGRKVRSKL